jgi:O-antigen ligase
MVLFSPWAFGATQAWSIWVINGMGYLAGFLFLLKVAIRVLTGYWPPSWDEPGIGIQTGFGGRISAPRFLTRALAVASLLFLAYCLAGALNPRAAYNRETGGFNYYHFIPWLPHSYEQISSWGAFFNYLAMSLSFWALRDWLLGKTSREELAERNQPRAPTQPRPSLLPERLRKLLWVLSVNGGILGLEAICQRLSGTARLLFFMPTHENRAAIAQFGPFAYRSNAAQYLNLLWPVSLSLWWNLERAERRGTRDKQAFGVGCRRLILLCSMIMAAAAIVSASRVGVVAAIINIGLAAVVLWKAQGKGGWRTKAGLPAAVAVVLGVGMCLVWEKIAPRFERDELAKDLQSRNHIYDMARPMANESPLFGTGPGTFGRLFQIYRPDPAEYWPAQLHNDWLETWITFGALGGALLAASFFIVVFHWFVADGIHGPGYMVMLFWAALAGCLFFARYDFPFQIYSIVFLFLVLCAGLSCLSHNS